MEVWVCTPGGSIVCLTPWRPSERRYTETHRPDKEMETGESPPREMKRQEQVNKPDLARKRQLSACVALSL